jgi:hypothetical protein
VILAFEEEHNNKRNQPTHLLGDWAGGGCNKFKKDGEKKESDRGRNV